MEQIEKKIRETAEQLLKDGRVDLVIGFEKGTLPLKARPAFITKPEDVKRLIWNGFCENNLAVYIPFYRRLLDSGKKIAVIAKGCDARSIVLHRQENVCKDDQVLIIGIPCEGMIDRRKVEQEVAPAEVLEATSKNDSLLVKGSGFEKTLRKQDFICDDCRMCEHRTPPVYDELIEADIKEPESKTREALVKEFESKTPEERWEYFTKEVSRCIRCYACRNACPACYCNECFVDCTQPQWIGTATDDQTDLQLFQIIRTYHLAGRCVHCGSCTRACPMDINISLLLSKLSDDAKKLFDYETGIEAEGKPVLNKYQEDDTNEGFFEEH
jgi:formate dehydrogenase subunit beta